VEHAVSDSILFAFLLLFVLIWFTGNMFYHFSAWWFFLIGLVLAAALGFASSGSDDTVKRPTRKNWTIRRWTLIGTVGCVVAAVGGFYSFGKTN
jgi:peptidoglycan/LPS O-acetylase OafA/YrhL